MKKCPFCAEMIQDEAVLCRYCGRALEEAASQIPEPKPAPEPRSNSVSPGAAFAIVVGAIVLFIVLLNSGAFEPRAKPAPGRMVVPQSPFQAAPVVTKAEYDQLRVGMSYSDAVKIIGTAGDEISRNDIGGYTTIMYSWANDSGSNMNAMFQNGALVSKAQFGLP